MAFHVANVVLLFFILDAMTNAFWRSAFVAALFAWHPLHVESVAWMAERKDVLSTFFWLLTMAVYVRYARKADSRLSPSSDSRLLNSVLPPLKSGRYWLVVVCYALGLMSKPMLVTLPFVLLLLDYWPLGRFSLDAATSAPEFKATTERHPPVPTKRRWIINAQGSTASLFALVVEKLPLFGLAGASSVVTFLVQKQSGTVLSLEMLPRSFRLAIACVSYIAYILKMVWPYDLAVYYPLPKAIPPWQIVGAAILLVGVTLLVIAAGRRHPYLPVGWFWYLGTLVPVIGIVQVGTQAMADRYTYVPLIGLFILIAWGIHDAVGRWEGARPTCAFLAIGVLVMCVTATAKQLRYWVNSVTLFEHALAVTADSVMANNNLGAARSKRGQNDEAVKYYVEALRLSPKYVPARHNLGNSLLALGRVNEAVAQFEEALRLAPDSWVTMNSLAWILATQSGAEHRDGIEAVRLAERAVQLTDRKNPAVLNTLAAALAEAERFDEAVETAEYAHEGALEANQVDLAAEITGCLKLYRQHRPCRTRKE